MSQNLEDDLFYFETDHLALRGNKDYSEVLKTLFILCAQRKQAIKDYSKATELRKEALDNPGLILEKILKKESLGMPDMHQVPEIPVIDWTKYDVKIPEESIELVYSNKNEIAKKKTEICETKKSKISHGKWTTEEQKRLEELLQLYPPEPIEMRRFKKIAQALGNRTLQQVTSRVQKYFLKLYKAGLPIPGRIPKSAEKYKRTSLHKHQRHNHYLWKPTTFFPYLNVPVLMDDLESAPGPSSKSTESSPSSSNYLMSGGYQEDMECPTEKSNAELQLELLKRVKQEKIRESSSGQTHIQHVGFKCDYCNEEPLIGARWHCITCKTDSIDFCTDCVLAQMYSDNAHPLTHHLVLCRDNKENFSDDSESNPGSCHKTNDSDSSDNSDFDEEEDEDDGMLENGEQSLDSGNISYNYLHSNLELGDKMA